MNVQRTVPYYFARLVGVDSGTMNVSAGATVSPAYSTYPEPIGLQYGTAYSDGAETVMIFRPSPSGTLPVNNWSTLALGGNSFTTVFSTGYNSAVSINDAVAADRGSTAGPVSAAIQSRISAGLSVDPSGSPVPPPGYTADDQRVITVTLVDSGAKTLRIKGFAEFWMNSVSNGNITGYWVANGVKGLSDPTGTAANEGALAISLTQ